MVSGVGSDQSPTAGDCTGHHDRDFVRFGAGAREDSSADSVVMERGQTLSVIKDALMQVTAVDVERLRLALHRLNDMGMGMAHARHIVVEIEVTTTVCIVKPDTFTAHDLDRLLIERRDPNTEQTLTTFEKVDGLLCSHKEILSE